MRRVILALLVLACLGAAGDNIPRVQFIRPPAFVSEGERIEIRLRIPSQPDNRRVTLDAVDKADGTDVVHTERQIDPDSAPLQVFRLILPTGDLLLVGQLWGVPSQPIATVTTPIRVRSQWGEE